MGRLTAGPDAVAILQNKIYRIDKEKKALQRQVNALLNRVTAAEAAKKQDITIHTVGIGSDDPFLLGPLSRMGATIRFDTRNLEKIASITGGQFFRAKDNKGFEDVMDTIDALEKTSKQRPALIYQRDLYPTLLLGGIAALSLAVFLRYTVLREIS